MDAKVIWNQNLSFSGSSDSGFVLNLDSTVEQGGDDDGFRPLELILIGLAGCTAMDVISILKKKRQQVTGFEVCVHAERSSDHPRVFTLIEIEYIISGTNIDRTAVDRAVELSITKYCPVQTMLLHSVPIEHLITIR
jgi:putative redox protein